jgi:hypothetical protein
MDNFEKRHFGLKPGRIEDVNDFLLFLFVVVASIGITNLVFYIAGQLAGM